MASLEIAEDKERRWFSQPSHQLLAVAVLGVVLSVALVTANVVSLRQAASRLETANESLGPARVALASASRYLAIEQSAIHMLQSGGAPSSAEVTKLRDASSNLKVSERAFAARAVSLPGDRRDWADFRKASETISQLQLGSFDADSGPSMGPTTETLVLMDGAFQDSQSALTRLTTRYDNALATTSAQAASSIRSTRTLVVAGSILGLATFVGVSLVVFLSLRRRESRVKAANARHELERSRAHLEGELQQAFDMVRTEPDAYALVGSVLVQAMPGLRTELLIADSSRAHFSQVVTNTDPPHLGCGVGDPRECPATVQSRTLVFNSSRRIAACPHLRDRPDGPCSAVCVPVTIAGKSIAVFHATGTDGEPPDSNLVDTLNLIGRKSGDRLGSLRAFAKTEAQARKDPLTGLLNRRSLENQIKDLIAEGREYVVAYGDLDLFKKLNDTHGHDTGDRALRLFARVLRDSVRPSDFPARYGGEEFVVVLPDCDIDGAVAVVERVREQLALHLADGQLPGFTVSFGVAPSTPGSLFSETLETADHALLQAKSEGRNRVIAARPPGSLPADTARTRGEEVPERAPAEVTL